MPGESLPENEQGPFAVKGLRHRPHFTRHNPGPGIVTQDVWVHLLFETRALGSFVAHVPGHLAGDRMIGRMVATSWKEPLFRFQLEEVSFQRRREKANLRAGAQSPQPSGCFFQRRD